LVVIEADPHHGQQIRSKPREPGVAQIVGRAGLARGIEGEPGPACARPRSLSQNAAHQVGDEIRGGGPGHRPGLRRLLHRHVARATLNAQQMPERPHRAQVRENRVRSRDFEGRGLEHSERDRRIAARRGAEAQLAPERRHAIEADLLGDLDCGDVPRVREGPPQGNRTVVDLFVVLGRPDLIVELPCRRAVVHQGRRREAAALRSGGLLEGRQVDKRLEDRTRLPACDHGPVVLRLVVKAAANHRQYVARLRIDGEQRRLGATLALTAGEQLVDFGQSVTNGVERQPLQVQVERRVDVHRAVAGRGQARVVVLERLGDVVDEVRRFGFERARHDRQRFLGGLVCGILADIARGRHRLQHDVATVTAAGGVPERRERRWRLDDTGNGGRLGKRQIADVLAEKKPGGFRHAADAERAALAERDVVQIELENLVLGRPALEH
jgi:hypothetical protein